MSNEIEQEITSKLDHLKHLKFEMVNNAYVAILIDLKGDEVVKGYGNSIIEAMNDIHSNFI